MQEPPADSARSASKARRPGELLFSLCLIVFSAAAFWQSYKISGFSGLSKPGVFPMLASGSMCAASVVIFIGALLRRAAPGGVAAAFRRFFDEVLTRDIAILAALMICFVGAMSYVGFVVAAALFQFVAMLIFWRRGVLWALLVSAGSTAAIYLIFRMIFQVVLPQGVWLRGWF